MVWLLILLVLNLSFCDLSHARHHKNKTLPSAVVVGTVFCDTCSQEKLSKTSHFISGATVAVECGDGGLNPSFREEVKTDKRGEFKVDLPVSVSKHVKKIEGCSVKLIRSSEAYCAVAAAAKSSSSFKLKSRNQGTHFFSAGFFTFKPQKQPNLCNQKPHSSTFHDMKQALPTPLENPTTTVPNVPRIYDNLPPLPFLSGLPPLPRLPPLPPLPPLPGFPILFPPKKTLLPPKKPRRPHFVLPPHRLHHPPLFPNPSPPSVAAAVEGTGGSIPSSPPSLQTPFPLPPVPGIPSPPRQTSP